MTGNVHLSREDIEEACRDFATRALAKQGVRVCCDGHAVSFHGDTDDYVDGATVGYEFTPLEPVPVLREPAPIATPGPGITRMSTGTVEPCNVPGCGESGLCGRCSPGGAG